MVGSQEDCSASWLTFTSTWIVMILLLLLLETRLEFLMLPTERFLNVLFLSAPSKKNCLMMQQRDLRELSLRPHQRSSSSKILPIKPTRLLSRISNVKLITVMHQRSSEVSITSYIKDDGIAKNYSNQQIH